MEVGPNPEIEGVTKEASSALPLVSKPTDKDKQIEITETGQVKLAGKTYKITNLSLGGFTYDPGKNLTDKQRSLIRRLLLEIFFNKVYEKTKKLNLSENWKQITITIPEKQEKADDVSKTETTVNIQGIKETTEKDKGKKDVIEKTSTKIATAVVEQFKELGKISTEGSAPIDKSKVKVLKSGADTSKEPKKEGEIDKPENVISDPSKKTATTAVVSRPEIHKSDSAPKVMKKEKIGEEEDGEKMDELGDLVPPPPPPENMAPEDLLPPKLPIENEEESDGGAGNKENRARSSSMDVPEPADDGNKTEHEQSSPLKKSPSKFENVSGVVTKAFKSMGEFLFGSQEKSTLGFLARTFTFAGAKKSFEYGKSLTEGTGYTKANKVNKFFRNVGSLLIRGLAAPQALVATAVEITLFVPRLIHNFGKDYVKAITLVYKTEKAKALAEFGKNNPKITERGELTRGELTDSDMRRIKFKAVAITAIKEIIPLNATFLKLFFSPTTLGNIMQLPAIAFKGLQLASPVETSLSDKVAHFYRPLSSNEGYLKHLEEELFISEVSAGKLSDRLGTQLKDEYLKYVGELNTKAREIQKEITNLAKFEDSYLDSLKAKINKNKGQKEALEKAMAFFTEKAKKEHEVYLTSYEAQKITATQTKKFTEMEKFNENFLEETIKDYRNKILLKFDISPRLEKEAEIVNEKTVLIRSSPKKITQFKASTPSIEHPIDHRPYSIFSLKATEALNEKARLSKVKGDYGKYIGLKSAAGIQSLFATALETTWCAVRVLAQFGKGWYSAMKYDIRKREAEQFIAYNKDKEKSEQIDYIEDLPLWRKAMVVGGTVKNLLPIGARVFFDPSNIKNLLQPVAVLFQGISLGTVGSKIMPELTHAYSDLNKEYIKMKEKAWLDIEENIEGGFIKRRNYTKINPITRKKFTERLETHKEALKYTELLPDSNDYLEENIKIIERLAESDKNQAKRKGEEIAQIALSLYKLKKDAIDEAGKIQVETAMKGNLLIGNVIGMVSTRRFVKTEKIYKEDLETQKVQIKQKIETALNPPPKKEKEGIEEGGGATRLPSGQLPLRGPPLKPFKLKGPLQPGSKQSPAPNSGEDQANS